MRDRATAGAAKGATCIRVLAACVSLIGFLGVAGGGSGCASKVLKADDSSNILKSDEFDKKMDIKEFVPDEKKPVGEYVRLPGPTPVPGAFPAPTPVPGKMGGRGAKGASAPKSGMTVGKNADKPLVGRNSSKSAQGGSKNDASSASDALIVAGPSPTAAGPSGAREPSLEDSEGFTGRRPNVDPFKVGERTTLEVSYFGVVAGDMSLEVKPFVEVGGRKSYRFHGNAQSTSVFAMFYAVDDNFDTFVDYETLVPSSYALSVKESKQLRETRSIFDWTKGVALFWDKKINAEKKVEEKRYEWEIPAYSQNIFSIAYYLRAFTLTPGKSLAMRLAHENENLIVTAQVIRKERITTPAGEFDAILVKPKIELNGHFKPVGDIFFWLSDDDRKFILRIESKIKIGKIVAVAKSIQRGND